MDELNRAIGTIQGIEDKLQNLSFGFESVGNIITANLLLDCVESLAVQREIVRKVFMDINEARFKDAQAASTNMLRAALAGALVDPDTIAPLKEE